MPDVTHCCTGMQEHLAHECKDHHNPFDCPDHVMVHIGEDYGIPIHDGGRSYIQVSFCPWCGTKLTRADADVVYDAVAAAAEPLTRAEIVEATALSSADVHDAVEVLVSVGEVEIGGDKRVRITRT
jgi:hypothetical protein